MKSYPTIKFFPKGSTEAEAYSGGRNEADFLTFLNGKAGTHRVPGGGLDATAGLITSLDDLIAGLTDKSGKIVETVKEEVVKAAGTAEGTYAKYYGKVVEKLGKNEGYVEKELNRLQGLLAKGGLVREKEDDLISRSNILRAFNVAKDKVEETVESIKEEL